MKRTVIGAAVLALGISTVGVASADKPGDTDTTKTSHDVQERDCGDGHMVTLAGPDTLWPPNHKMVDQLATATDADEETALDEVTLTITPDVLDAMGGDGNTELDWESSSNFFGSGTGSAEVPFRLRAERSGKGDGRVYTIGWLATFNSGAKECGSGIDGQTPFEIFVPHDQGKGNDA